MQRLFESLKARVIDHWYGRLSLGESFWINCFFVNLGASIIVRLTTANGEMSNSGLKLLGIASLLVSLWQLIGLWRSAQHNKVIQPFWSAVVRVLCVLNVVAFVFITVDVLFGGLGIIENMPSNMQLAIPPEMSPGGQPETPPSGQLPGIAPGGQPEIAPSGQQPEIVPSGQL